MLALVGFFGAATTISPPREKRRRRRSRRANVIDTGVEVIDKANVAEFKSKLAEMKKN